MAIESRTFRYFVVLAEELHFGRAAARLNIVQPALSAQIKALEDNLGTLLFVRTKRHVELTAAGQSFLVEARRAVAQIEHAEAVGRQAALGHSGMLRIGFVGSAPFGTRMPWIISRFRQAYPEVELSLEELSVKAQIKRLMDHSLDAGFARLPLPSHPAGLKIIQRIDESILVAVPAHHHFADKANLKPADLAGETFVTTAAHESAGWMATLGHIFTDGGGIVPNVIQTSPHLATVVSLVNTGLGISLVPNSLHNLNFEGVRYIPLSEGHYKSEVALIMREETPLPIISNFLNIVEQYPTPHSSPRPK